ncbi:MAG: acyl carrier protein [Kiritimatiellae bacterium]|jgi:acyl carrier protein|nr:acyl carrier protein [Kiritimatiellia bacterium]MBQ2282531.1 acyl carrier protein [Kiritimatiellia bacterium]
MTLEEKVKTIICETLNRGAEEVTPAADFNNDLGADSLDLAELVMKIEDEFGSMIDGSIPEEDTANLKSLGAIVEYLKSKGVADEL